MNMDLNRIFDRMDKWRHFPDYQLERRADLLFTFYLASALSQKYPYKFQDIIAPEFPVRVGAIDPSEDSNLSFKIDYAVVWRPYDHCECNGLLIDLGWFCAIDTIYDE